MTHPSLFDFDEAELKAAVLAEGAPVFRAKQILEWMYVREARDFSEMANLPKSLRESLLGKYALFTLQQKEKKTSQDGESVKYLFETSDRQFVESVLILQKDRATICVSTQIGCKIGCVFCASGKGKFERNLRAGEILEQVLRVKKDAGAEITNVVYMGMGEPLDNFEAVMKSLGTLQASWGLGMGSRRITVSTSGITPRIIDFVKRNEGRVRLSVSLHSALEETRTRLVPINKRYGVKELARSLREIRDALKREITFEYTLIEGINDAMAEAEAAARLAKPLHAKINLIPCNPIAGERFRAPEPDVIERFRKKIEDAGVRVTLRQTAGRDIDGACGQLRRRHRDNEIAMQRDSA